jgi:hypothetical protein
MYRVLCRDGLGDMVVFTLEVLDNNATACDVLVTEQQWIQRFNCPVPRGYNASNAASGVPHDGAFCFPRYFGSRDYARRLYTIYKAQEQQRLDLSSQASVDAFFSAYAVTTVDKLWAYVLQDCLSDGLSVTDPAGPWIVPAAFVLQLRPVLETMVRADHHLPERPAPGSRTFLVCQYWNTLWDKI